MLSSSSRSLSSCCSVARPSAFHSKNRGICRHWWCFVSETKRLVSGWAGAAVARHQGHDQWPVLVTVLAASREKPEQVLTEGEGRC